MSNKWFLLIGIFFTGIALRVVNFGDWLVFKSDQARDALLMDTVLTNGFSSIPLLGPQVAGTELRLGPVTYLFQYISGVIFGASPESYAYPDLFFGIMTLPILFLLFRRFFSWGLACWLTALASVSFVLITFSRFAWNPNSLPFFSALFAWFLLSALDEQGNRRWWHLIGSAICLGIIAQLHLAAAAGLIFGFVLFLIIFRPLKIRELIVCMVIVALSHFPVVINEIQTDGDNLHEFALAFEKKGTKDDQHGWYEKVFRAYQDGSQVVWLVMTGRQDADTIITKGKDIRCDSHCRAALPYSVSVMLFFGLLMMAMLLTWRREENEKRRQSIGFVVLWVIGFLCVTIPLAYQLETRFYLGLVPMLLIIFGFGIERLFSWSDHRFLRIASIIFGVVVVGSNLLVAFDYLQDLSRSQISSEESSSDLRFGTAPKVTLGQLRNIAEEGRKRLSSKYPTIVTGESLHVKSMYYVLSSEYGYSGCYIRGYTKVPEVFNQINIEYTPDQKAEVEFGTLSATFRPASDVADIPLLFPDKCLNY
ncbi:MAG: glycosyltransferase family 39 protein [Candidatus Moranbacteria bacterium]|nr:glycosyltransferase family 39 protein [Candidatus Moranbacteria bacterium]MBP6034351.1 glycosyltransferase family 39 protein [Candidatus Moranbacteria bacterium]